MKLVEISIFLSRCILTFLAAQLNVQRAQSKSDQPEQSHVTNNETRFEK